MPVSVTLDEDNLLWLRGRLVAEERRSLSEMIDEILTEVRTSGRRASPSRSVVGTVDIAASDPLLQEADTYIGRLFESSLGGAMPMHDQPGGASKKRGRRG